MAIKVIGAGLGRTGTLSLKSALEELGFGKCYHMTEVLARIDDARVWDAAARGEPVDWDTLFQGYQSTVDWPGCAFYQELLRRYPEAKVVLTVRDPRPWYTSARQTIYHVRHVLPDWARRVFPRIRHFTRMLDRIIWDGTFQGRFEDESYAIEVFNRHNAEVQRVVPPEQLLVYEVRDGWGPLCAFLGVPAPDGKPFPHLNDTAEFRARTERVARIVRTIGFGVMGIVAVILAGLAIWLLS
jgi:hypothetical protein